MTSKLGKSLPLNFISGSATNLSFWSEIPSNSKKIMLVAVVRLSAIREEQD
jgi:hypothetical protein